MGDYNLDALCGAMPAIKVRGRMFRMRPLTPAILATIEQQHKELLATSGDSADGIISPAAQGALSGLVYAMLPDMPLWMLFGGYRSRLHRWFKVWTPGLDVKTLFALVQVLLTEVRNLMPHQDDVKNAKAPPVK